MRLKIHPRRKGSRVSLKIHPRRNREVTPNLLGWMPFPISLFRVVGSEPLLPSILRMCGKRKPAISTVNSEIVARILFTRIAV